MVSIPDRYIKPSDSNIFCCLPAILFIAESVYHIARY